MGWILMLVLIAISAFCFMISSSANKNETKITKRETRTVERRESTFQAITKKREKYYWEQF